VSKRIPREHGIEHEPHLRPQEIVPDDSNYLDEEPVRAGEVVPAPSAEELAESSVSDEPTMKWRKMDRREMPGFAEYMAERIRTTPTHIKWWAVVVAALAAGPFAILGALMDGLAGQGGTGFMAIVIFGPIAEEMLKIAGILWLVEKKPWLVPSGAILIWVGFLGGLGFAVIENWVYLYVYYPLDATEGVEVGVAHLEEWQALAAWRWSICLAMHAVCSTIAAIGVSRMWHGIERTGQPARVSAAYPFLVAAMLIHGGYNALAVALSMMGQSP